MTTLDRNAAKTEQAVSPAGSWQLQVRFADAKVETQELTFIPGKESTSEGVVVTMIPGLGGGYWESSGPRTFRYYLLEKFPGRNGQSVGLIVVEQSATLSEDGQSYTAEGTGTGYDLNKQLMMGAHTTTQATRLSGWPNGFGVELTVLEAQTG